MLLGFQAQAAFAEIGIFAIHHTLHKLFKGGGTEITEKFVSGVF